MGKHHTKDKGDIGVLKCMADLAIRGFTVLTPHTEHSPFDLVAYRDNHFLRIQVKYRVLKNGVLNACIISSWADRHGVHSRLPDRRNVDYVSVYCPDTDTCYYIPISAFTPGGHLHLRITSTKNQHKRIHLAQDFLNI